MTFILESSVFEHGTAIPSAYTCQGDDISPPLRWSHIPPGTKSLALIVDDPDAPDPNAPKMTWVHWLLYNIPRIQMVWLSICLRPSFRQALKRVKMTGQN